MQQPLVGQGQRPGLSHVTSAQAEVAGPSASMGVLLSPPGRCIVIRGSWLLTDSRNIRPGPRVLGTMPLLNQPIEDENDYSLTASLDNVRNFSTLLKAIHFRDHATCFATKNGIKVTVENAKCVQANAFIQVWKWASLSQ